MSLTRIRTDDPERFSDAYVNKNNVDSMSIEQSTSEDLDGDVVTKHIYLVIGMLSGNKIYVDFTSILGAESAMNELALKL